MRAACVLLLLVAAAAGARALEVLPNTPSFFGLGYDVLSADPTDLDNTDEYRQPVFALSYTQNTTSPDGKYLVPDNATAVTYPACAFDAESKLVTNTFDFQLTISLSIKVYIRFLFWTASKTKHYQDVAKFTASEQKYQYRAAATCSAYTVGFSPYAAPALDPEFRAAVLSLPSQFVCGSKPTPLDNCDVWATFLDTFGTHVVTHMDMGGVASQTISIDTTHFQEFVGGNLDLSKFSDIKFAQAMSQSTHGLNQSAGFKAFDSNTTTMSLSCGGGDQEVCNQAAGVERVSFPDWAATVPSNPLPHSVGLTALDELLTPAYFGASASSLPAVATALRQAVRWYLLGEGRLASAYQADVGGVADHRINLQHAVGQIPSLVQVHFTQEPQGNTTTAFPLQGSFHFCQADAVAGPLPAVCNSMAAGNPANVDALSDSVGVTVAASMPHLRSSYDAETLTWTNYTEGYWVRHVVNATPTFSSAWKQDWNSSAPHVTALDGIPADTAFLQVYFAPESAPEQVYPLVWRRDSTSNPNPVALELSNGTLNLHINGSKALFGVNQPQAAAPLFYNTGFWRVNTFSIPANAPPGTFYDSGWFQLGESSSGKVNLFKDLQHGLGCTPELVQVWFSATGSMTRAYPIVYSFQGATHSNPATVELNDKNILLHFVLHPNNVLFSSWNAASAAWDNFSLGTSLNFRVVAAAHTWAFEGGPPLP